VCYTVTQTVSPTPLGLYQRVNADTSTTFLVNLQFDALLTTEYGAPSQLWLRVDVADQGGVQLNLQWFNKTATRIPEALWMRFNPKSGLCSPLLELCFLCCVLNGMYVWQSRICSG
jgi:hypothetical protein